MRLLQLASPTLPVGAYSYSQGLEAAIDAGIVTNAVSAQQWIGDLLEFSMSRMEAPLLFRMITILPTSKRLNCAVPRESRDCRTARRDGADGILVEPSSAEPRSRGARFDEPSFPAAFAAAVNAWQIDAQEALQAYLWAWLENQVMAAVKAVPLGQTDGSECCCSLANRIPGVVNQAITMRDEDIGSFAPGFAILSSKHETQYSRLFRS